MSATEGLAEHGRRVYLDTASGEALHPAARESLRGGPRRGLRRPAAAAPRRSRGAAGPRQRPGRDRRGPGPAARRGDLHVVGHRGGAPRPPRAPSRRRAPRRHDRAHAPSSTRRSCRPRPGRGAPPARSPSTPRRGSTSTPSTSRTPRSWPASPPTTRSAPCSPWPSWPRGSTAYRSSSTPAPRPAGCPFPTAGRRWPRRPTSGAGPPGVGILAVRRGARWREPYPEDDRAAERESGFENVPGDPGGCGGTPGRGRRAGRRERASARPRRPHPDRGGRPAGGRGRGLGGRPAAAPRDVLLPLRRRRGAGDRAGPAGLRGGERVGVHVVGARAEPRPGRDGRAHPRQRAGLGRPRRPPPTTSSASWRCCPACSTT